MRVITTTNDNVTEYEYSWYMKAMLHFRPLSVDVGEKSIIRYKTLFGNDYIMKITIADNPLKIIVKGRCWDSSLCDCSTLDGCNPEAFGYPPFHEGCICVVEEPKRIDVESLVVERLNVKS